MVSSGISDVVSASVHSEKNLSEEVDYDYDYYEKSQETTVFSGRQKLTSAMKLRPEK